MGSRVGRGLDLRRTWLLFENGVVAKAVAFTLLAVAADRVSFVALADRGGQWVRCGEVRLK